MKTKMLVVFAIGALISGKALAASELFPEFDRYTEAQKHAISQLAAGYSNGLSCDFLVETPVAAAWLSKAFSSRSFSAAEVAGIANIMIGVISLHGELLRFDVKTCAAARKSFGPGGSVIPGLLQ
jgi:hypothetical protein